jgi:hypothetical protein
MNFEPAPQTHRPNCAMAPMSVAALPTLFRLKAISSVLQKKKLVVMQVAEVTNNAPA